MDKDAIIKLLKDTYNEWSEDKAPRLAAALSYYTVFSLAPLLVIAISVAGLIFGEEAARGQLVGQMNGLVGQQGAEAIQSMIQSASKPSSSIIATIIGLVTLLFGASGVFGELQASLNTIWEVQLKPGQGILETIKQRFFSFSMVLGTGFLLLVSLVISAVLAVVTKFVGAGDGTALAFVMQIVNFLIAFGVTTLLFALIFKYIPDVEIEWHDVWIGAAATALLFSIGRLALGIYLGRGSVGSSYGAAGSLVIVLLWVYYSAQILFMGAEFTQVYAKQHGSMFKPKPEAEALTEEARAQQGMPHTDDAGSPRAVQPTGTPAQLAGAPAQSVGAASTGIAGFIAGVIVGRRKRRS